MRSAVSQTGFCGAPKASVKIRKDHTKTVEDPAVAQPKTNISVGFSFWTLEVNGFAVQP